MGKTATIKRTQKLDIVLQKQEPEQPLILKQMELDDVVALSTIMRKYGVTIAHYNGR